MSNITKKEIIWRQILHQTIEHKKIAFTQKEIADKYSFSLSTVFNALKAPRQLNALEGKRGLVVRDVEKFLYLWATFRKVKRDIIYQTSVTKKVFDIEGEMPPSVIFGAYSAFLRKYKTAPADYDKVYVYIKEEKVDEIKRRFPLRKGYLNLIVLKADPWLENFGKITPDCQTFVDLWNLPDWYAKVYLEALKEKMVDDNSKNKNIVVKAMCFFDHNGKLLLNTGYDRIKKERFFRIIGGTVNSGEKTEKAIKREIKEELGCKIENLKFLTVIENIFSYEGQERHEIAFIYKGDLADKGIYKKKSIHHIKDGEKFDAEWVPITEILRGKVKLYPAFDYQKLFS